jgi:Zn-dependent protease
MDGSRSSPRRSINNVMDFSLPFQLQHLPFVITAILVAFTFHEFSHAFAAYKLGDPTAYKLGRVTLNPVPHISILGMLFIVLLGFGWARPVPVDRSKFKQPRRMSVIVSAVGPISNLILAVLAALAVYVIFATGWLDGTSVGLIRAVGLLFFYLVYINLLLFLFNLIPLPPLDGYRITEELVPPRVRFKMRQYEPWGVYLFLLIVFITPLYRITIGPVLGMVGVWQSELLGWAASITGTTIQWQNMFGG